MISQNPSKHVLFLARWYPDRYDPMPGLFIQRHAEAVALYHKVSLIYVHAKSPEEPIQNTEFEWITVNKVTTLRIYYGSPAFAKVPLLSPVIKAIYYIVYHYKGFRLICEKSGKPDIVHVNVLTRLGVIALILKTMHGIRYIITEHWSRYLPVTGTYQGFWRKLITRLVVQKASAVTTVTANLATAMKSHGLNNQHYTVVANVADTRTLIPSTFIPDLPVTLLHISCFEDRSKNISGLLRVVKRLSETRNDFRIKMVGDGQDFERMISYSDSLGINKTIIEFTGLLEGAALISAFHQSHFLVMFSNYENMPVVINEAFCCGLPVVATKVGGIPEVVTPELGKLVNAGDEDDLSATLNYMIDNYMQFDRNTIHRFALENFSYPSIGEKFSGIYHDALSPVER
jgi:glycosyltransferase involved in cell wall biosynthesis